MDVDKVGNNFRFKIIYDGQCQFCRNSVKQLKAMDLFARCDYFDFHTIDNLQQYHPSLNKELAASQLHLITPQGKIYAGFFAFRRISWFMPMLYPLLLLMYLPTASFLGPRIYRWIAQNRYLLRP